MQRRAENLAVLPTSAVPFMVPRVSVKVPDTPMPTGFGPPNSGLSVLVARGGVTLHQHLALEGIALHGVAAGVKQIGIAATAGFVWSAVQVMVGKSG